MEIEMKERMDGDSFVDLGCYEHFSFWLLNTADPYHISIPEWLKPFRLIVFLSPNHYRAVEFASWARVRILEGTRIVVGAGDLAADVDTIFDCENVGLLLEGLIPDECVDSSWCNSSDAIEPLFMATLSDVKYCSATNVLVTVFADEKLLQEIFMMKGNLNKIINGFDYR